MHERTQLTTGQRWFGLFLVIAGVAITGIAFRVIYSTVTTLVQPYVRTWPWSVVVSCEIAFVFLFGLGILLAWAHRPSPAIRNLFMGLLIVGSVVLNVWAARGNVPDMAAHLVVLCAFFACLLTGKAGFQMMRGSKVRADKIGLGEWMAHPIHSARLQRWMLTWGEPSRELAHARYMRLLYAIAIAQDDIKIRHGWRWRKRLPLTLRYQFAMGQLPEFPGDDWQAAVAAHVESALNPVRKPAAALASEPSPQPVQQPLPSRSESQPPARPKKPSQATVRTMSGTDLAPYVEAILGTDPLPSRSAIQREFHVSAEKARDALKALTHEAQVITLGTGNSRRL